MENTEDVSLPPAQLAGWELKIGGDEAHVTEKSHFRTVKNLTKSCAGRKVTTTARKNQIDAMNHKSNGKSRIMNKHLKLNLAIIIAGLAASAPAQTVTYTFEPPQFTAGETTPLLNEAPNIGSSSFLADFVSTPNASGIDINTFAPNSLFSGQDLYVPSGQETLTISFNQPVNGVQFDFATDTTSGTGELSFSSSAGNATQPSGSQSPYSGGVFTFNSAVAFTSFQLEGFLDGSQVPFAIDNLQLTLVPEPTNALALLGTAGSALVFAARRRK